MNTWPTVPSQLFTKTQRKKEQSFPSILELSQDKETHNFNIMYYYLKNNIYGGLTQGLF